MDLNGRDENSSDVYFRLVVLEKDFQSSNSVFTQCLPPHTLKMSY